MSKRPKVVQLGAKDDLLGALEALRRELPKLIEHAAIIAQFRRAYFLALVKEGFSEQQALALCSTSISI